MKKLTMFFRVILGIKQSAVIEMQKKSNNVFNVFTKTLNDLKEINGMIESYKQVKLDVIAAAQVEHDDLHSQLETNNKMVVKLEDFVK
jgi:hypothetical protein